MIEIRRKDYFKQKVKSICMGIFGYKLMVCGYWDGDTSRCFSRMQNSICSLANFNGDIPGVGQWDNAHIAAMHCIIDD